MDVQGVQSPVIHSSITALVLPRDVCGANGIVTYMFFESWHNDLFLIRTLLSSYLKMTSQDLMMHLNASGS